VKLVVFSHKPCWRCAASPSGFATNGGFPFQMQAIAELFDQTTLVVPCYPIASQAGEIPLAGSRLRIAPLHPPMGTGARRKALFPLWLLRNSARLLREFFAADAVHAPIPGDVGTVGMVLALLFRKPLCVRHCGNWFIQETPAERFWKWFMERFGGGRNVMLATGGAPEPPSAQNPAVRWIFSTSLTERQLKTSAALRQAPEPGRARLIIVCRQEKRKGTGVVIESLPLLLKDLPNVTLDVVGGGSALASFRELAAQLGVKDRVRFHGPVGHEQVIQILREADLFCYPTTASEGFPKSVLEALACGLPVMTTRVSVLPTLLSNGCGALIDEPTPTAMAKAVREIATDPKRYLVMSSTALETARQFSMERWRDTIGEQLRSAWGTLRRSE
jgi:glycosyltransferase involved in cell wall biosynthesis